MKYVNNLPIPSVSKTKPITQSANFNYIVSSITFKIINLKHEYEFRMNLQTLFNVYFRHQIRYLKFSAQLFFLQLYYLAITRETSEYAIQAPLGKFEDTLMGNKPVQFSTIYADRRTTPSKF